MGVSSFGMQNPQMQPGMQGYQYGAMNMNPMNRKDILL